MSLLRRRRVSATPVLDLEPLEFDDHARVLVKLAFHRPIGHRDLSAPHGVDVECECGRAVYLGHMVAHVVAWLREARLEVVDLLLDRIGQPDVVSAFGRDQVATTLRVIRAVTGRPA